MNLKFDPIITNVYNCRIVAKQNVKIVRECKDLNVRNISRYNDGKEHVNGAVLSKAEGLLQRKAWTGVSGNY